MNALDIAIGKKLRLLRASLDHEPDEFARKVQISRTALYRFETGTARVPAETLHAVAEVFQVPLVYFFSAPLEEVISSASARRNDVT